MNTPNFTLAEFEASQTATRLRIANRVPEALLPNARATLEMLERIRAALSAQAGRPVPVIISSGYRSENVNRAVGGSARSDHLTASAADITAPAFGSPLQVCRFLAPRVGELGIGQLIHEFGAWVHVSTRMPDKAVNRIITISHAGTSVGVVEA